jgi:hypothetical protein
MAIDNIQKHNIVNPDRKMKNSIHSRVHTLKHTWDLGARGVRARGLSDCVEGSWRDRNRTRKYPKSVKETLDFSF